jgi:putative ABC transport system permease protein
MTHHRRRWSSLFAVLCIALGIAAVSAVMGLVNATLVHPLPFPGSDRLVRIWMAEDGGDPRIDLSQPEMLDLERDLRSVEVFAGVARSRFVARLPGGTERMRGEAIDADYFPLLGVDAARGRLFAPEDFRPDAPPTVLLSHALWTRHFGADPAAVGRFLDGPDTSFRIIGVLPAGFQGTIENDEIDVWLPLAHYQPARLRQDRVARMSWTLARLAPDAGPATLQSELDALQMRWRAAHPTLYASMNLRTEPFGENWREPLRRNATLLLAGVFVLLAIAIANVGALLLARALDRKRELALRRALGAGRLRLASQLLWDTGRLALAGGSVGALAAPWVLQGLLALSPLSLPTYLKFGIDPVGIVLVVALLGLTAFAAAVLPAWLGSRVAPASVLAGASRASAGHVDRRLWAALIGVQIALSFVLLVGGALLMRSYQQLATLDLGFRSENVLRMAITLAEADHGGRDSLPAMYSRLQETLARQPGVRSVGLVSPTLPPWDASRREVRHAELELPPDRAGPRVGIHAVDPGLFDVLGIPVRAGRLIDAGDGAEAAPVAVVSAALAERLGGPDAVLGTEIEVEGTPLVRARIVGVAGNVAWDGVGEQDTGRYIRYDGGDDARGSRYDVYLALAQHPAPVVSIGVHAALPPEQMLEPLRRVLAQVAPASAVHWTGSMDEQLAEEYAASRFYLTLIAAFGLTALLLAGVGLFALLSHALLQRQHEIGIRLALGADGARVARLLVVDGLRLLAIGLGLGALLAMLGARAFEAALYGVGTGDPLAYAGAASVLAFVAVLACVWPLRRALAIAPTVALRND